MVVSDSPLVLAPYLEPVVRGRRVVILGDSSSALAPTLLDRGARLVHVYDPSAARAAQAAASQSTSRSLVFAALPEGDMPVRDGAFDVVVVSNLSAFANIDGAVSRARRLVDDRGYAIFLTPNPERFSGAGNLLTYYELYDAVALQFPEVRMFGQAPFSGVVIADFAQEGDPNVVVDTSLLERGAEDPTWFLALGTHIPRRLDPYTIVQVPADLAEIPSSAKHDKLKRAAAPAEPPSTQQRPSDNDVELQALREQLKSMETQKSQVNDERVGQLTEQLDKERKRAGDNHVRAGRLEHQVRDLDEELRRQRERAFNLSTELEEEKKRRTRIELELSMVRRRSDMPTKQVEPKDSERIEALTKEVEQLKQTIAHGEARIAELTSERDAARGRERDALAKAEQLQDDLDDLRALHKQAAETIHQLENDLQQRQRRLVELDERMVQVEARQSLQAQREQQLARVQQERDELKEKLERASVEREPTADVTEPLARVQQERDELKRQLEQLQAQARLDLVDLESRLAERGRVVADMQQSIQRGQQIVGELTERLGALMKDQDSQRIETLEQQVRDLSSLTARQQAELITERWLVAQMQAADRNRPAQQSSPSEREKQLEGALRAAHEQLDALRQALLANRRDAQSSTSSETS